MKIDNPIQNTSFTPAVQGTSVENTQAPISSGGTPFAHMLEQAKAPETPATRVTKSGDTLIGIVREEAKSKGITLTGPQEYRLALSLASQNGIANPNQINTGMSLQMGKLSAMLNDPSKLNTALAQSTPNKSNPTANSMPAA